ncbi:MAG: MBOAT family O-acyltransferase [Tepidisphaeraceae bacterium]|jgi:alginate O-acetyltransferase complex protein AlgI
MVFSSHIFIFYFLPLAIALYYVVSAPWRFVVLTVLSYVFYAWTNPWFVFILLWSTIFDFCCGNLIYGHWQPFGPRRMVDEKPWPQAWQRKFFLILSLCNSLGLLLAFKYWAFATENLNALRAAVGLGPYRVLTVLLPVGISFYTFESISYVVDIYRGWIRPASVRAREDAVAHGQHLAPGQTSLEVELRGFLSFACYLAQFPHLVAGPIIRFQDLEPQLYRRHVKLEYFSRGIVFVCLGFAKKILIADTMGEVADMAFSGHLAVWTDAWFGMLAYALQIYFDFSGYSDMAIGLGLMLGFEFAKNFDAPYKSASITEFWRRWHISLSTWLRDYLYIGLGGNRLGKMRTYANLMIVMLLGGLWHGASWTFVIWGGIHGGWLAFERMLGKQSFYAKAPHFLRVGITFLIVCIAWVFFRADNAGAAVEYVKMLFSFDAVAMPIAKVAHSGMWTPAHLVCLGVGLIVSFFGIQTWDVAKRVTPARAVFALLVFSTALATLSIRSYTPFIYFRF